MTNNFIAADAAKKIFHAPCAVVGHSFLVGHWRVHHKKLKKPPSVYEEWIELVAMTLFFNRLDKNVRVEELHHGNGAAFTNVIRTFDANRSGWLNASLSLKKQRGK